MPKGAVVPGDRTVILGLSCFYHDAAAAICIDGQIAAAAQEERFTRRKHDPGFPHHAIHACLEQTGLTPGDVDLVAFYDNPYLSFDRAVHTIADRPWSRLAIWLTAMPKVLRQNLDLPRRLESALGWKGELIATDHHLSHAASAFYPSPFDEAAILTVDGVGEWATATIGHGSGADLTIRREMHYPHSLGLLYSAFTQYCGFKVNSGEYKLMGLAPFGDPKYRDLIMDELVDVKADGSLRLELSRFAFLDGRQTVDGRFEELFGAPMRAPESEITQHYMDVAASIQEVTEEIMLRMARHAHEITGSPHLCLAGGVALNCVANGRILREGPFDDVWIQPAAGDAGGSLGAALAAWHLHLGRPRPPTGGRAAQGGSFWGPEYSDTEIVAYLDGNGLPHHRLDRRRRAETVARLLADGKVVGHFSGRMEFGPRALGARSILGDARSDDMQSRMNLKIKFRESFRPFAPSVLEERIGDYFELERPSPYMLLVAPVRPERRVAPPGEGGGSDLRSRIHRRRSDIPAVTHVDYSARIQSVSADDHRDYYEVLRAFEDITGCGVIVNTSFNVRGEPIVCTPDDAYRCFMRTGMDALVMGDHLVLKEEQPDFHEDIDWREDFQLD